MYKIVIMKGQSQYDCSRFLLDELASALKVLGNEVVVIDLFSNDCLQQINLAINSKCDFFISFNAMAIELKLNDGRSIYDALNIPLLVILGDHPFSHISRLDAGVENVLWLCFDNDHVKYIDRYFPDKFCTFIVLNGHKATVERDYKRNIDLLFAGSLLNPYTLKRNWKNLHKEVFDILCDIEDIGPDNENISIVEAIQEVIKSRKIEINENIKEFMSVIYFSYESYFRNKLRYQLLKNLDEKGIKVECFGNIEDDYNLNKNGNLAIHKEGNVKETLTLMKKSKIVINTTPFIVEGTTDRVLSTMMNGGISFTDRNKFFVENFKNGENIVLYNRNDLKIVPEMITDLLSSANLMEEISRNGQEVAENNFSIYDLAYKIIKLFQIYTHHRSSSI